MKFEIKNRFTEAVIFTAELEARFEREPYSIQLGAAVKLAIKAGAYLADADLADADLADADLAGAYLADAYLADADLADADLAGAYLAGAYLAGADLARAYLAHADLAGAYLAHANLAGAYLAHANLAHANLADANLAHANLAGAYLAHAKIRNNITITQAPICISGLTWFVTIWDRHMQIGCEFHSHDDWRGFDTETWLRMGGKQAVQLRDKHLATLLALCDAHAAQVNKTEAAT